MGRRCSRTPGRAALYVLLLTLAPSVACARSVVLLLPEPAEPSATLTRVRSAMIETLAERGVRLVHTPDGPICEDDECARAMAEQTGATFVARLTLDGETVRLSAVPSVGAPSEVDAPRGEDVAQSAAALLSQLLDRPEIGVVGFLVVEGDRPGRRVQVDGEEVGHTPLRVTLAPGEHRVRVRLEDGARERTVTIVGREETTFAPASADEDDEDDDPREVVPPPPVRTESSPFNFLLGAGLAVGGVVALISPLTTFAQEGQCVDEIENVGCVEKVAIGPQTGVLMAVGIAALAAAVVIDVTAPIRVEVGASPVGATVRLEGRF